MKRAPKPRNPRERVRIAQEGELRGIEVNAKSKSPDVYLVVRVWPKLALWVKALVHPAFRPDVERVILRAIQEAVIKEFGPLGQGNPEVASMVMRMTDREALVELMR